MKQKSVSTTGRGRPPKQKAIKTETDEVVHVEDLSAPEYQSPQAAKPAVEILSCISYQKFRYSGENRPGKKYQEKDFMELKLVNLGEKVVRVVIICTDAENKELIHPNGLVGKDCHDGIYDKEYAVTKQSYTIKIPYLRTERIKTKKNELNKIRHILKSRAEHLPSPYRERCESQCTDQYTFNRKFDTTKVCLGVIVTVRSNFQGAVNGSLHAISHVVNNASEKTALNILKLSNDVFSSTKGGLVDVFTTEDGPAIENDKYYLYVSYQNEDKGHSWTSEKFSPMKEHILYKRIISYMIPSFGFNPDIDEPLLVTLHLICPQSNQSCECPIYYYPDFMIYEPQRMKRRFTEELEDFKPPKRWRHCDKSNSDVKAVLKESLRRREDDRRNSLPPAVEIVHRYEDGALVRQPDSHTVPDAMDQDVFVQNGSPHSPNDQTDQEFHVLAAAYSNSVPSDTVLIITNDGPDNIENAITEGVSYFEKPSIKGRENNKMIIIEPSRKTIESSSSHKENCLVNVVPDLTSNERDSDRTDNEQLSKISLLSRENITTRFETGGSQSANKPSNPSMASKRNHKTDSPWAVGSDDESDEAMNIFNELSYNKQRNSQEKHQKRRSSSDKVVLAGGQKTISILSGKGDSTSKVISNQVVEYPSKSDSKEENQHLSFTEFPLPSDINLNSEVLVNFNIVREVNSSHKNDES